MENPKVVRVAVVIPCYRVVRHIEEGLSSIEIDMDRVPRMH
jgi:hypothetical protein